MSNKNVTFGEVNTYMSTQEYKKILMNIAKYVDTVPQGTEEQELFLAKIYNLLTEEAGDDYNNG